MTADTSSILSLELLGQLQQLLGQLTSPDNAQRTQAEQQLNHFWVAQQPEALLVGLAHLARRGTDANVRLKIRAFASLLFRRLAFKAVPGQPQGDSEAHSYIIWDTITGDARLRCMQELMLGLKDEAMTPVRHMLCDTVAEIYKNCSSRGDTWTALQATLFELSNSPNAGLRESAFRIFAIATAILNNQPAETVHQLFAQHLSDNDPKVRLAVSRAMAAFLGETTLRIRSGFGNLMMPMLEILGGFVTQHDNASVSDMLNILIELAERTPKLYRPIVHELVTGTLKIIQNEAAFEDQCRQSALELLLTLSEAAPGMMKKVPDFANNVIPPCLAMMATVADDEGWYATDQLEDADNSEASIIGEQAMDRLARALGGHHVLPVSFSLIPRMLQSESWKNRHAALMAISSIAEGCAKQMEGELGEVIDLVLPYFRDQHPRVRYAACNAIGQMSTDFAGILQKGYHQKVLSGLIPAMDDVDQPRVRTHAAAALVNFCEASDKEILEPYMDTMFEKLLALLNTGKMFVQEQAITTIATLAESAQERFVKFYGVIMPMLINVLSQAATKEFRMLRGKALECATLIALSVGKEVFSEHVSKLTELMSQIQYSDDPQSYYLLHAWVRICKILGSDFAPYLPAVMPSLMRSMQLKPDFAIIEAEEDVESRYSPEDGWEFVGIEGQQFGIKTTVLEEKCAAVEMVVCYARELGPFFQPYVGQVLDAALPLLRFYFHEGVRFAAATVLPMLISCSKQANADAAYLQNMWIAICQRFNETMLSEADPNFLQQLFASYAECIEELGDKCMTDEQLEHFIKAIESQLNEYYQRVTARQEERAAQGYDAEDEDGLSVEEEEDDAMLAEMSKALHVIVKAHRELFFRHFERLLPFVDGFLANAITSSRQWALCLMDDIVEFTGPASWKYQSHFLTPMVAALTDEAQDIRQAAAYGIGMCAQHGGPNYHDACITALNQLIKIIQAPGSREPNSAFATENAISAITKICKFIPDKVDINTVIPIWFSSLPILEDEEEAPMTYEFLLSLLDSQHPAIQVANEPVFLHLGHIFIEVLISKILPDELNKRIALMLKTMLENGATELKNRLVATLDDDRRTALAQWGLV